MQTTLGARIAPLAVALAALAGCDENGQFVGFQSAPDDAGPAEEVVTGPVETIERDVEAPEVFSETDRGLWDGRPSLGGVWVAYPDVADPERVVIRNTANGTSVVGALFRRERDNPGPPFQVSSDAAAELSMLAGQPAELQVIALRREEVPVAPAAVPTAEGTEAAPSEIETASLDDPIAAAAAAIDAAEQGQSAPPAVPASAPDQPFVQIGIFSEEANANNTAANLREAGLQSAIRQQTSQGNTFWRVIVGPAASSEERDEILRQVNDLGFTDAFAVGG